jgi:hypothetical protein
MPQFFTMAKRTTRGKVYRHLRDYSWTYAPPRQVKFHEVQTMQHDIMQKIEQFKEEQEEKFRTMRLEFNMRYNELCCMGNEDKDIGPNMMNTCTSPENVIDLTYSSDDNEAEWIHRLPPFTTQPLDVDELLQE